MKNGEIKSEICSWLIFIRKFMMIALEKKYGLIACMNPLRIPHASSKV